jgi:hypothetical protein
VMGDSWTTSPPQPLLPLMRPLRIRQLQPPPTVKAAFSAAASCSELSNLRLR